MSQAPESYLAESFTTDLDDAVVNAHERDLGLIVHNMLRPHLNIEDVDPKVMAFDEWGGDLADYIVTVEAEGPSDARLQVGAWHISKGYHVEFNTARACIPQEDGGTFSTYELFVYDTGMSDHPIKQLRNTPDARAAPLTSATTFLLVLHYLHEE